MLTKWEDSPFETILTTVIDHLCVSELLDKWELTKWEVDQMGIDEVGID